MPLEKSTKNSPIEVSVIVPCRNEEETIADCVRSILQQEPVAGGMELIVADGLSTDNTREVLRQMARNDARLRVIDNPGQIVSSGLNAALGVARGAIIVRMDAHTLYAPDYIRQCITALQETGADNVGGPALTAGEGYFQRAISAAYHSPFAVGGARFHNPDYEGFVDTVPYGCWPCRVFSEIGLFDEELVRNQDDEFNLRLIRSGGKVWQSPRIKSWYRPRGSLRDLFRQYCQYGYWKVRVIQKHRIPASIRHVIPGLFLLSLAGLFLLSWWWRPAIWALGTVAVLYAAGTLGASFLTAAQRGWKLLPVLPIVFATYHVSYGLGFLRGLWDFVVIRRGGQQSLATLSRGPAAR
ncbi:MAG: glycosyltransferase family 2 protein [Thermomicrobiales bacterium]|nr:MAG: glycosyltransferase family 2 protein [Thermomicrobiales bacterium]